MMRYYFGKADRLRGLQLILLMLLIPGSILCSCKQKSSGIIEEQVPPGGDTSDTKNIAGTITLEPNEFLDTVSPLVMGFNIEYSTTGPDEVWRNGAGRIPKILKSIGTRILRYPGGTVLTFYHWTHPHGQKNGHVDNWDAGYNPGNDKPSSSYMDIDEYLNVCKSLEAEPLIGINMASGKKHDRVQDGIDEAVALMEHCIEKGFHVKYFYLGNEPYQEDANYTYTAAEYADMINQYVPAMKKVDKDIKIIANSQPIYEKPDKDKNLQYTKTLITTAGKNIDFIDIHYYWSWGGATFSRWKSQINMMHSGTGMTYAEQRPFFRNLAASLGHPDIDLVSLEWNVGKFASKSDAPSQAEAALMIAEQFTQFIQSGMKMTAFWTISWPNLWYYETLVRPENDYQVNKVYSMFKLYTPILGQGKIKNTSFSKAIETLSIQSLNKDTIWVYMINKEPAASASKIKLHLDGFNTNNYSAVSFNASDKTAGVWKSNTLRIAKSGSYDYVLEVPEYSLTRVELIK